MYIGENFPRFLDGRSSVVDNRDIIPWEKQAEYRRGRRHPDVSIALVKPRTNEKNTDNRLILINKCVQVVY